MSVAASTAAEGLNLSNSSARIFYACHLLGSAEQVAIVIGSPSPEPWTMPTIECQKCGKRFDPLSTPFADMIRCFAEGKQADLGIECPLCAKYTNFNPTAFMAGEAATPSAEPYRCPVSCCAGFVSFVEDADEEPFWGCGECGSIWYDKAKLFEEITAIVEQHKYRKRCYQKKKGQWIPADPDKEIADYEDRVYDEPEDESEDYVRG